LLINKTALNESGSIQLHGGQLEVTVYVIWSGVLTAGAVTVETADETSYTGTWAALATVPFTSGGKQDVVALTGAYRAIRARISTALAGGGNVSVRVSAAA